MQIPPDSPPIADTDAINKLLKAENQRLFAQLDNARHHLRALSGVVEAVNYIGTDSAFKTLEAAAAMAAEFLEADEAASTIAARDSLRVELRQGALRAN